MSIQNPLNYITDNPDNPFEKAKSALGNAVGNAADTSIGEKVLGSLKGPMEVLNYLATPYRDYVAPALTAGLMEANSRYREQNKELSVTERFQKTLADSKKGLTGKDDWRRGISPGRALVGVIGDWTPGTQATDKIDWSNAREVDDFFTSGSAQFFSGIADAGFNILDPAAFVASKGTQIARRSVTRDINKKMGPSRETLVSELKTAADAPDIRSGANTFMEFVEKDPTNITAISNYGFVATSSDPTRLATAISSAYTQGGRTHVADLVGAALGHKESYDKIMLGSKELHAQLLANSGSTQKIQKELQNLKDSFVKNTDPTPEEYNAYSAAEGAIFKNQKVLDDGAEILTQKLAPASLVETNEQVIDNKVWSKFSLPERLKAAAAEANTNAMFVSIDTTKKFSTAREMLRNTTKSNFYGRMLMWVNPSTPLKESPAGVALIGGAPARLSYREANARTRQIAKLTGLDVATQKALTNEYRALNSKSSMYNWYENLQSIGIERLLYKHYGKDYEKMTPSQLESAQVFARVLVDSTVRAQLRAKKNLFTEEKRYTITDPLTGNPESHAYLDDFVEEGALERALAQGRNSADETDRAAVRNAMGEQPLTETQVPNVHFSVDLDLFDQVMSENPAMIGNVMRAIVEDGISPDGVRVMMEKAETKHLEGTTGMGAIGTMARTGKDLAIEGLDSFYTFLWKPVTLMSLKYTTRNVGEGQLRFAFTMADFATNYGFSWTDMIKGVRDPGSVARTVGNRKFRKSSKKSAEEFNKKNNELADVNRQLGLSNRAISGTGLDLITASRKGSLDAVKRKEFENTDGLTMCVSLIKNNISRLEKYKTSGIKEADAAVDYLKNKLTKNILEPSFKNKDVDAFIKAIVDEDYTLAHSLADSTSSVDLARGLSEYSASIKKTLDDLSKYSTGGADTVRGPLENTILGLERLHHHADLTAGYLIKRGELRDELDNIITEAYIKNGKTVSFSKKKHVEIYPGVFIDQSLAGNAGEMLRTFTSSRASTTGVLADDRRLTGQSILNSGYARQAVSRNDGRWAQGHADYVNNVMMRDAVQQRIIADLATGLPFGQAIKNSKKWVSENSTEALRWKEEVKQNIVERGKAMGNPNYNVNEIINEMGLQIKQYLPEASSVDGKAYGNLYQRAVDGFDVKDSLNISYRDRHDVMASLEQSDKSFTNFYKNAVSSIFNIVGTMPEDHLVRHPFFNMTYEASAKRITRNLVAEAKRSNPKITDFEIKSLIESRAEAITSSAQNRAYKELMNRMYSVERHTDPGKFFRFVTPFFMAHQNSSRFWLGTTIRNPGVAYTLSKIYNAPYRSGLVTDPTGQVIGQSNPWDDEGDKQRMDWLFGTKISPTNLDIIFQGQIPILPTFGAPGSATITAEILKKAAKQDGIDTFIQKYTGKTLDEFANTYISPFYVKQGDTSVIGNLAEAVVPVNSWMVSMAALSEGKFPLPQVQERWQTRLDAAREEVGARYLLEGKAFNNDAIYKESVALAKKSLIVETVSSFTGPLAGGKVAYENTSDLTKQMNQSIKAAGGDYNVGMVNFVSNLEEQGYENAPAIASFITSSFVDNRYGLISNTATISGVDKNMKAFSDVDKYQTDNPFVGALFNIPSKDNTYSSIADDAMYGMSVNGKPLKSRNLTAEEATKQQQMNAGWAQYFGYIDQLSAAAKSGGIDLKDSRYKEGLSVVKESFRETVAKQFPYWAAKNDSITLAKSDRYIAVADYFLNDKTFMSTVGKKNKAVAGLKRYMDVRAVISKEFQDNVARTGYTTIDAAANEKYALVMNMIGEKIKKENPDFTLMYDRYLAQDELNPINRALVGGE